MGICQCYCQFVFIYQMSILFLTKDIVFCYMLCHCGDGPSRQYKNYKQHQKQLYYEE